MSPNAYDPACWPTAFAFLSGLKRPQAQAILKHIDEGRVSGMSYRIEAERIYLQERPRLMYFIQIEGWEYTIRNDSIETPVLSFTYLDGERDVTRAVQNVRVMNKAMTRGYRVSDKTLRIASYLMRQIESGVVPDAQRVLAGYKFLPAHPLVPGFFQNSFSYANGLLKGNGNS